MPSRAARTCQMLSMGSGTPIRMPSRAARTCQMLSMGAGCPYACQVVPLEPVKCSVWALGAHTHAKSCRSHLSNVQYGHWVPILKPGHTARTCRTCSMGTGRPLGIWLDQKLLPLNCIHPPHLALCLAFQNSSKRHNLTGPNVQKFSAFSAPNGRRNVRTEGEANADAHKQRPKPRFGSVGWVL
jgi:hypothetical protein